MGGPPTPPSRICTQPLTPDTTNRHRVMVVKIDRRACRHAAVPPSAAATAVPRPPRPHEVLAADPNLGSIRFLRQLDDLRALLGCGFQSHIAYRVGPRARPLTCGYGARSLPSGRGTAVPGSCVSDG
jgi:hypothetical protein